MEGRTDPVSAYRIVGIGPQRSPQGGLEARPLGRFVGRERVLAELEEAVTQARTGRGQVVGIVGEPGMGKSRLLIEFRRALSGPRLTLSEGRCLSYGGRPRTCRCSHPRGLRDHRGRPARRDEGEAPLLAPRDRPRSRQCSPYSCSCSAPGAGEALAGLTPEAVRARTSETLGRRRSMGAGSVPSCSSTRTSIGWISPRSP